MSKDLWVLTTAPASRLHDVEDLQATLGDHRYVTVTTQPDPLEPGQVQGRVLLHEGDDWNISKWWNTGLDWIAGRATGEWDLLVTESDAVLYPDDLATLRTALREGRTVVGADSFGALEPGQHHDVFTPQTVPTRLRLPGYCMLVRGELGIRFDPQFRWWYADDDYVFQHIDRGCSGLIGGTTVRNLARTPLTGNLERWAHEDARKFQAKWGCMPI